ncbi:MAG: DnaJ domain-containing protein [Kofleriaceae bacterium]|nr:DnaJ domain-containing protein [Kofleriaceae bacterium]
MSGIPDELPDFGDIELKPVQNPNFVPGQGFGTEEYFVWSRCDGAVSLRDVILSNGFPTPKSVEILVKLRHLGALLLPGESEAPSFDTPSTSAAKIPAKVTPPASIPLAADSAPIPGTVPMIDTMPMSGNVSLLDTAPMSGAVQSGAVQSGAVAAAGTMPALVNGSEEELAALAMENILDANTRRRIIEFRRMKSVATLFDMLEIEDDSDKRTVKRAYFRLSKEFHPDRYYNKELGPFEPWLAEVFKMVTQAFGILGNNRKRSAYENQLRGGSQKQPQTKAEHAEALFHSACDAELQGQSEQALKLFAASLRMEEKPRRLRRAAMCAVSAGKLSDAEEYAKKGVDVGGRDASYLRVLADVYRAGSRLDEALEVLQRALKIDTENDVLFGELQSDLAAVEAAIKEKLALEETKNYGE